MKVQQEKLKKELREELKKAYGDSAEFKDGQEEAIISVLSKNGSWLSRRQAGAKALCIFWP